MDKAVGSFIAYQKEAEERYQKWEEERWEKEMELQEKERKERREHEVRLFQMLGDMLKPSYPSTYHSSSPSYNFDYEY